MSEEVWHKTYFIDGKKDNLNLRGREDGSFFEDKNLCDKCKEEVNPQYMGDPLGENKVVNCFQ